jgi:hypothetical protein
MSAQRASGNATDATRMPAIAHVRIPGSARTYEVRDVLRGMGLRWDPLSHAWHGTLPTDQGSRLARELGLRPQIVPTIEAFSAEAPRQPPEAAPEPPAGPRPPIRPRIPRDGSRTHAEARVAFPEAEQDDLTVVHGRFSLLEITSGLPDDSREADERFAERRLRELRARVKTARAVVALTPGLAETLQLDWERAARFYARHDVSKTQFNHGVPPATDADDEDCRDWSWSASTEPPDARNENDAVLPGREGMNPRDHLESRVPPFQPLLGLFCTR